jgi:Beta-lactamase
MQSLSVPWTQVRLLVSSPPLLVTTWRTSLLPVSGRSAGPMSRDTLVRISSTSKPMTATAVLSLIDDGVVGLDGPVDDLLPDLVPDWISPMIRVGEVLGSNPGARLI